MRAVLAAMLLLSLVPATDAALPAAGVVLASGPGMHHYETTGTCDAAARFVVELDPTDPRAITILGDTTCLAPLPYYSGIGGCTGGLGQDIVCARHTATNHINATLTRDGAFHLDWKGPGFFETIDAQLRRHDV